MFKLQPVIYNIGTRIEENRFARVRRDQKIKATDLTFPTCGTSVIQSRCESCRKKNIPQLQMQKMRLQHTQFKIWRYAVLSNRNSFLNVSIFLFLFLLSGQRATLSFGPNPIYKNVDSCQNSTHSYG
jgi:hypothetical protein